MIFSDLFRPLLATPPLDHSILSLIKVESVTSIPIKISKICFSKTKYLETNEDTEDMDNIELNHHDSCQGKVFTTTGTREHVGSKSWVENPKKQYFSYVKRANVTKILRVWTFQKFKYFGLDQMFQTNYFPTRHHLVIYL